MSNKEKNVIGKKSWGKPTRLSKNLQLKAERNAQTKLSILQHRHESILKSPIVFNRAQKAWDKNGAEGWCKKNLLNCFPLVLILSTKGQTGSDKIATNHQNNPPQIGIFCPVVCLWSFYKVKNGIENFHFRLRPGTDANILSPHLPVFFFLEYHTSLQSHYGPTAKQFRVENWKERGQIVHFSGRKI